MTSLFQQDTPPSLHQPEASLDDSRAALESRDNEILALKQELQALKSLQAKGPSAQIETDQSKLYFGEVPLGVDLIKQRNDRMMGVLAVRERQMKELHAEYKEHKVTSAKELQKERQANQALKDEIAALHGQLQFLKQKYIEGQKRIAELKHLEERLTKMKSLWSGIGNFFDEPSNQPPSEHSESVFPEE